MFHLFTPENVRKPVCVLVCLRVRVRVRVRLCVLFLFFHGCRNGT